MSTEIALPSGPSTFPASNALHIKLGEQVLISTAVLGKAICGAQFDIPLISLYSVRMITGNYLCNARISWWACWTYAETQKRWKQF